MCGSIGFAMPRGTRKGIALAGTATGVQMQSKAGGTSKTISPYSVAGVQWKGREMAQIEIVDRASIPVAKATLKRGVQINAILEAVANLDGNQAVRFVCQNPHEATYLVSNLAYHKNKRHRPGTPTLAQLGFCLRGSTVFCWLEHSPATIACK